MENLNEFVPKIIGKSDSNKIKLIRELYDSLVNLLNPYRWECENLISIGILPTDRVFELLKMNVSEMEIFLKRSFIKANGLSFPGLNVDKIIENGLLDLPADYDILLKAKKEIDVLIEKILKTNFVFPLSNLFSEEENIFVLNAEFETTLNENMTVYTESLVQNEVLEAVEQFCNSVNKLIELKIVHNRGGLWVDVGRDLALAIENEHGSEQPLQPFRLMFCRSPLNRFSVNKVILSPDTR